MTHKQHPIGSGSNAASTTDDVLAGIDLPGKNVIVTGGHVGLGLEATRALAKAGASVTVGSRHPDRAAPALTGIERIEIGRLDLLDPSMQRAVGLVDESGRPIIDPENGKKTPSPLLADIGGVYSRTTTSRRWTTPSIRAPRAPT